MEFRKPSFLPTREPGWAASPYYWVLAYLEMTIFGFPNKSHKKTVTDAEPMTVSRSEYSAQSCYRRRKVKQAQGPLLPGDVFLLVVSRQPRRVQIL